MKLSFASALLLFLLWVARAGAASNSPPYYTVQLLGFFEEYHGPFGRMLNDGGEVASLVATNEDYGGAHLFLQRAGSTNWVPLPLPVLESGSDSVTSFNTKREALIRSGYNTLLYRDGEVTPLSNLVNATYFTPAQLNNRGVIVGGAQDAAGGPSFAYRYYRGRQKTFRKLAPDSHAMATAVSGRGRIVGGAQVVSNALHVFEYYHAVIFGNSRLQDLGTLPGHSFSLATGVNIRGEIIGFSAHFGSIERRAFLYRAGKMRELPPLPGDVRSEVLGINNKGQIVGNSFYGDPEFPNARAVVYINQMPYELNKCVAPEAQLPGMKAKAINAQGVILVTSDVGSALLTPSKRPPAEPE